MKTMEQIFAQTHSAEEYFKDYCGYLGDLMSGLDRAAIGAVTECFMQARKEGRTIFFAGNGGSAATASHFAQDLGEVGRKVDQKGFKTISLAENVAQMTAISNDYGYEHTFSIQMKEHFSAGDVLVVISASGNSPNVVSAVEVCQSLGGISVGLVGFDGGKLAGMCDHVLHVRSNKGEFGPVEDIHLVIDHMITSFLIMRLGQEKG